MELDVIWREINRKLDGLIAGQGKQGEAIKGMGGRIDRHVERHEANLLQLRRTGSHTSLALARLEASAATAEHFNQVAARKAHRKWTTVAILAAAVSAGAAIVQVVRAG